jgi:serine O-acetyltransferase
MKTLYKPSENYPPVNDQSAFDLRVSVRKTSLFTAFAELKKTIADIKADVDRYTFTTNAHWLLVILTKQGLWLTVQYRVSRWVEFHFHVPVVRLVLKIVCAIGQKIVEIVTGCELPNRADIGLGLLIPHPYGIVVHCDTKIGENCVLAQHVSIGHGGRGTKKGVPQLGDRLFVGPGARIFGAIKIGNDVAIGANAVVTKDLPDHAVAVGIPAQIISFNGSREHVHFRDKEMLQQTEEVDS